MASDPSDDDAKATMDALEPKKAAGESRWAARDACGCVAPFVGVVPWFKGTSGWS